MTHHTAKCPQSEPGDWVTKDSSYTAHEKAHMHTHMFLYMQVPFVCTVACGGWGTTLSFLRLQLFLDGRQPWLFIIIS